LGHFYPFIKLQFLNGGGHYSECDDFANILTSTPERDTPICCATWATLDAEDQRGRNNRNNVPFSDAIGRHAGGPAARIDLGAHEK
jgi:hypothetical protein